jgi:hypothetical protein
MAKPNRSVNHDSYEGESGLRSSALGACSVRRYREIWGYGSKVLIVCLSFPRTFPIDNFERDIFRQLCKFCFGGNH